VVLRAHEQACLSSGTHRETPDKPGTAAQWSPDGRDEPIEWVGPHSPAAFSPGGKRVVTASPVVSIWPLDTSEWTEPLWQATAYCLSVEERVELLGEQPDEAAVRRSSCTAEVAKQVTRGAYRPAGSPAHRKRHEPPGQ
jgi:hypothetical protein